MSLSEEENVRLQDLTRVMGELIRKQFPNAPPEYVKEVLLQELVVLIKDPEGADLMKVITKIHSRLKN